MKVVFRPVLSLVILLALAILISLGTWQLKRLEWKQHLIAAVETRTTAEPIPFRDAARRAEQGEDMAYTAVTANGYYKHDSEHYVFGALDGAPGWFVFTPLMVSVPGARSAPQYVMVNRGFVPDRLKAPSTRPDGQGEDLVSIRGLFRTPEEPSGVASMVRAPNNPAENQYYQRDPRLFADVPFSWIDSNTGYYIDSSGAENPADWPKGGTTRLTFNNRHLEYALTWYGLALAMIGVFLAFSLRPKG